MALTGTQKEQLHNLYRRTDSYRSFFTYAEERGINAVHTTVSTVEEHSGLNTARSIALMKELAQIGVAEFKLGAGGHVSELTWKHDVREIGKAARVGLFG